MKANVQVAELRLDDPCHEDWDKMTPADKGKFCSSCKKIVHDFTNKTRGEIIDFFRLRKFESACVRVKEDVLNKPAILVPAMNDKSLLQRLAWFAYALYLVFGSVLFSCNTPDKTNDGVIMGVVLDQNIIQNEGQIIPKEENFVTTGVVVVAVSRNLKIVPDTVVLPDILVTAPSIQGEVDVTLGRMTVAGDMSCSIYSTEYDFDNPADSLMVKDETPKFAPEEPSLKAFPNPCAGEFQIQYKTVEDAPLQIDVFDISGQQIKEIVSVSQQSLGEFTRSINIHDVAAGIYFVRMTTGERSLVQRVVVAH